MHNILRWELNAFRLQPPAAKLASTTINIHFLAAFFHCVPLTRKFAVPTQGVLEGMEDQEGMGELAMCSIHSGYWPVD